MPIKTKSDSLMTVSEAAEYLGYPVHTIRTYIHRGLIQAEKFGPAVVLMKSECDRFSKEKRGRGRPSEKN
jgi:excisionase family DNA binding protein